MQLKHYLYQSLYSLQDPVHVERFQRFFNLHVVDGHCCIKNYYWYYLFKFGSLLGYEVFYVFIYSFLYWNIDSYICRRLMLIWSILMYIGQLMKELIKLPRPSGKNLIHMEPKYLYEYGMPSTHAMLATMMPITLYTILADRYEFSTIVYSIFSIIWLLLICCSRLYLGMHSILDILVGITLTLLLLLITLPILNFMDYFLIRNPISPIIIILIIIISSILYPQTNKQSPSRGDTIAIISATGGVYIGSWFNYKLSIINDSNLHNNLFKIKWSSFSNDFIIILLRFIIGIIALLLLKLIGKIFSQKLIHLFTGIKDLNNSTNKSLSIVQIPMKMITFIMVGLAISFFGPFIAKIFNIERQSMMYEA